MQEKDRERFQDHLDKLTGLTNELHRALRSELPRLAREGGFVQEGYHDHIDELLQLSQGGKDWITEYQETERIRTSILSLKVSYNRVFGYYIEVTKTHADKVPDDYFKKQTLVNAERYATQTLKVFEEKILSAEQTLLEEELQVFMELEKQVLSQVSVLQAISQIIAEVDLVQSFAETANRFQYTRPTIVEESKIRIEQGRHPVVEAILEQDFIPNDTKLDVNENRCMIITGPNMGGKSTYIRQVALICLMAHTGSFVPAAKAEIGILDRIFTRVGASDNLSEGQSTFMVEMLEVSNILRNATSKSLVILDEVGRGTSTYDGLSLAQAITESLTQETKCQTLFATHYHELLKLEHSIQGVRNYCILVDKDQEGIRFLHQISAGGADESYGIDIAKLAGFPDKVLQRATHILETLELEKSTKSQSNLFETNTLPNHPKESIHDSALVNELKKIDVNQLTPIESLQKLAALQELVRIDKEL